MSATGTSLVAHMARRIDIELTSRREDGTWTWRAPGARQPRGVVAAELVPAGAKVGDVLRAEAEFGLEGIAVTSVAAVASEPPPAVTRIEVLGSGHAGEGVSVRLAARRHGDEGRDGRGARRRPERSRPGARPERPVDRAPSARQPGATTRAQPGSQSRGRGGKPGRSERARTLVPSTAHRNAMLATLRPEQLPVAEQLLRGGIPAVRQAIEEQNARARAEGRTEVTPEPLLAMAEQLLPVVNLAAWKDRAVTARTAGKETPLRELRAIVAAASTVTLDDEGRELAAALRETLDARVRALRDAWLARITAALEEQRVVDALRAATRPPEPAARLPADLAVQLADAAGRAMAPDVPEERWLALLDAVTASPVRRTVKPAGLPAAAGPELLAAARHAAGAVPELARLLGLPIPPPPGPRRAAVPARRS